MKLTSLLPIGALILALGCESRSPIHEAVKSGDISQVKLLLTQNPKLVNSQDYDEPGTKPLYLAAENGDERMIELLLDAGADMESVTFQGTALSAAASRGHLGAVKLLVARGAMVNTPTEPPLINASRDGHEDVVEFLVAHGANVNTAWVVGRGNTDDRIVLTPLKAAAEGGHREVMQFLSEHGADVNAQGSNDFTALQMAVLGHFRPEEQSEAIGLLLDKGANVQARGYQGKSALHLAAEGMPLYDSEKKINFFRALSPDVIELLVLRGADVNAKDAAGKTVLYYATTNHHDQIVEVLVQHGAK